MCAAARTAPLARTDRGDPFLQDKLLAGRYSSPDDFAADVRLVWTNAQTYNLEGSEIFDISVSLSKFFEGKFSKQFGSSRSGTKRYAAAARAKLP